MTLSDLERPNDRHFALFTENESLWTPIQSVTKCRPGSLYFFHNTWFMGDNAHYLCGSRASCYTSKNNQEELRDHLVSTVCQNYQSGQICCSHVTTEHHRRHFILPNNKNTIINNIIETQLAGRQNNIKFMKPVPMLYTVLHYES